MEHKKISEKVNKRRLTAVLATLLIACLILGGCSQKSAPEQKVTDELNGLKTSESVGSEVITLRDSLSDEGKDAFDGFLKKLRDFDYEITCCEERNGEDGSYTVVTVRIRTYDFGKEYLATWTDYLKEHKDTIDKESDLTDFYEELFKRLSALDERSYIRDVEIVCMDPIENGEWIAGIKDNEDLQDAVFGGMMGEMKALAEE